MQIQFTLNGTACRIDVPPQTLLVEAIRDHLGLTGTHVGCDTSQCGCCTVHLNGRAVKSCSMLAAQADGADIVTIEGLGAGGLHPVQEAFSRCHGLQCGFCTPGMIMVSADFLQHQPQPNRAEIEQALEGNLCRCTGYINIVEAVHEAAQNMRQGRS
ncbi:MAG: (2Fe-2S)-binding protein [Betaproteobacteria bacterium]